MFVCPVVRGIGAIGTFLRQLLLLFSYKPFNALSPSIGVDIKFTSLDYKGLNNPIKDSEIMDYLQHFVAYVYKKLEEQEI